MIVMSGCVCAYYVVEPLTECAYNVVQSNLAASQIKRIFHQCAVVGYETLLRRGMIGKLAQPLIDNNYLIVPLVHYCSLHNLLIY
jgi:hypothetical protein